MFLLVRPSLEMSLLSPEGCTAATETEYCVSGCSLDRTTLVFFAPTCSCNESVESGSQLLTLQVSYHASGDGRMETPESIAAVSSRGLEG